MEYWRAFSTHLHKSTIKRLNTRKGIMEKRDGRITPLKVLVNAACVEYLDREEKVGK